MNRLEFLKGLLLVSTAAFVPLVPVPRLTGKPKKTTIGGIVEGMTFNDVGQLVIQSGSIIRNCTFYGFTGGIRVIGNEGQTFMTNCILIGERRGLKV